MMEDKKSLKPPDGGYGWIIVAANIITNVSKHNYLHLAILSLLLLPHLGILIYCVLGNLIDISPVFWYYLPKWFSGHANYSSTNLFFIASA